MEKQAIIELRLKALEDLTKQHTEDIKELTEDVQDIKETQSERHLEIIERVTKLGAKSDFHKESAERMDKNISELVTEMKTQHNKLLKITRLWKTNVEC